MQPSSFLRNRLLGNFSKNTLIYLTTNVLSSLLPFLLLPFLVRALGPEEYGTVGLAAAIYSLALVIIGVGSHDYIRACILQKNQEELESIICNATAIIATTSILFCLVSVMLSFLIQTPINWPIIVLGCISAFGQKLIDIRLATWQMQQKPWRYSTAVIALSIFNFSISLMLVFSFSMLAEGRILGMWLPPALIGILFIAIPRQPVKKSTRIDKSIIAELLNFGVPLIPHAMALSSIAMFERVALAQTPSDLGVYFAAFQASLPMAIVVNSANLQFRAWSDRKMKANENLLVVRSSYALIAFFFLIAAIYSWLLGFFYPLLVGEYFVRGYPIAVIMVFSAAFRGFYLVVVKGLMYAKRTRPLMRTSVTLTAVFVVVLQFQNSMHAIAWLHLGYYAVLAGLTWIVSAVLVPQPWLNPIRQNHLH